MKTRASLSRNPRQNQGHNIVRALVGWLAVGGLTSLVILGAPLSATRSVRMFLAASSASVVSAQEQTLKIIVLEGEDGVNIIDKKTAVKPIVEVKDKNDLPVAGVAVTFVIIGAGATFNNGLHQLTVTTDNLGRATVSQLTPIGKGAIQMQARASYQGQIATRTIHQTNFATAADALKAGKIPGASQGGGSASSAGSTATTSNSAAAGGSGAGAAGGGAAGGGAAGGGAGAGAAAGAAATTAGGAAGGGIGLGTALGVGAAVAGGSVASVATVKKLSKPDCSSQQAALEAGFGPTWAAFDTFFSCINSARTAAQENACFNNFSSAYQRHFLDKASAYCACAGSSPDISDSDKAAVREMLSELRSYGLNIGSTPSCFQ
jgi:hypothetical protein